MTDTTQSTETVTITVDGRQVQARPGEMVIAAAERAGVHIPRFCYHPRLEPVGMCRMCLVNIDTGRGPALAASCVIPVSDGMVVDTTADNVAKAQDGVLEFLLINHPLDCPVCDKGGECPLQDNAVAFGPGESRYIEEKRHFEKPIPISDLVQLDRERCILCDRCTRFATDVAGDPLISFVERGNETQILTFPDEPFASYFSGNVVQLCPVGALTATPYRFKARPWDLDTTESTCTTCSVGCRVEVHASQDEVIRLVGVDSEPVNHGWLCDKGRFSYEATAHPDRLQRPLVATGGGVQSEISWPAALDAAAEGIQRALDEGGPQSVAFLGGARLTNEDAYAWCRFAKGVVGTDHVDCQLDDGLPGDLVSGTRRATIDEACAADVVLLMGPDLKEELPVLYLRLRQAALAAGGPKLVELAPAGSALTEHATVSLLHAPGEGPAVADALLNGTGDVAGVGHRDLAAAREVLGLADGSPRKVVCVLGRASVAESGAATEATFARLAGALTDMTVLPALRRSNVMGALDAGLAPEMLPGRVSLHDGRSTYTELWGKVPDFVGLGARQVLEAAVAGKIGALVLMGADPLASVPDADLAARAMEAVPFVVAVDTFSTDCTRAADVVLPVTTTHEKSGTVTNIEGRITVVRKHVTPPGMARTDWTVATELARRFDVDFPWDDKTEIWAEFESASPVHAGITPEVLADRAWRDGVPAPLPAAEVTISVRAAEPATDQTEPADESGEPESAVAEAVSDEAEAPADAVSPAAVERAPLLTHTPRTDSPAVPPRNAYDLRLVAGRQLYDGGSQVAHSGSLTTLAPGSRARLNRYDAERLGVATGGRVRVTNTRASHDLVVIVDDRIPRGSIGIAFGQSDRVAASLVSGDVTDVKVESV